MVEIRPLTPTIGAEITGVDVRALDDDAFARIHDAFLKHIVIAIRGQDLTMEEFLAFSRRFGPIQPHIVRKSRHPKLPELMVMDNKVVDTRVGAVASPKVALEKRGAVWHTDTSYNYVRAKATQLYSRVIPSTGGDTLFSNTYEAYESLPAATKQRIEGLEASYKYGGRLARQVEMLEAADQVRPPAVHALVRTHPETGRKAVYFNPGQAIDIVGLDPAESDALIAELTDHLESPDGDYRHKWQVGDLVAWDNRCAIHAATGDYPPHERRTMWRTTIMERDWNEAAA
jgi:taurine dioxygenase